MRRVACRDVNNSPQAGNTASGSGGADRTGDADGSTVSNAGTGEYQSDQMLSVDARKVVLVGAALFFVAFVVLLPFWSWLGRHDHRVWLWTALAGWLMGMAAMPLIRKHTGEGRLG